MFRRPPNPVRSTQPDGEADWGVRRERKHPRLDKGKFRTGLGATLLIGAIYWAPAAIPGASASAAFRGCSGIGASADDFCLSLDLGFASAVLRAAL